ncbi:hypothetical protein ACFSCW_09035 [Sphingomonas tabacisoli]|uniref:DUF3006 domain-containing protein n=1 Tax=Sphingomonas tabacisoli TaxID=2249466 RepID=A0ABW4I521_9SPHN
MTDEDTENGLLFIKPAEVAYGRVVITPGGELPYKVVFRLGETVLSEHPVPTVREGEALIRSRLHEIQFTTRQERPHPDAPPRRDHLSSVE